MGYWIKWELLNVSLEENQTDTLRGILKSLLTQLSVGCTIRRGDQIRLWLPTNCRSFVTLWAIISLEFISYLLPYSFFFNFVKNSTKKLRLISSADFIHTLIEGSLKNGRLSMNSCENILYPWKNANTLFWNFLRRVRKNLWRCCIQIAHLRLQVQMMTNAIRSIVSSSVTCFFLFNSCFIGTPSMNATIGHTLYVHKRYLLCYVDRLNWNYYSVHGFD